MINGKRNISDFKNNQGLFLFLLSFFTSVVLIFYPDGELYDCKILILYSIVSGISLFGVFLAQDSLPYSVNKTFYIFHYFFFGLAPAVQFKNNITFFGAQDFNAVLYYELGLCLIFVQIIYFLTYNTLVKEERYKSLVRKFNYPNTTYNFYHHIAIGVLSSVLFLYLISEDFEVLLVKPHHHWQKMNTKLGLFGYTLLLVVRAVPLFSFLLYKFNNRNKFSFRNAILLFFVLLVAFPTSLPRATMASYYLPIVLIYMPFFSKKNNYGLSFIVLFFVLFPLLNFFRSFKFLDVTLGFQLFETVHMDAFHNFAQLYSHKIITGGEQLLGSVLFFVQESHWADRPVGTGQMLAEVNGYSYTNISMPLWGEGYANFGVLGIFLFVVVLAFLNSFLDLFYKLNKNGIGIICFFFFIGYEFYLLRGDLYSSFKKLFGFILALIFVKVGLFFLSKITERISKL